MTAGLSSDCGSAIPSTMTTFFLTLTSDSTLLESTAGASFSIKVIRVLFVKQCHKCKKLFSGKEEECHMLEDRCDCSGF